MEEGGASEDAAGDGACNEEADPDLGIAATGGGGGGRGDAETLGEFDRKGEDTFTTGDSVGRLMVGEGDTRIVGDGSTSREDLVFGGGTEAGMLTEILGVGVCLIEDVDGVDRSG